MVIYLLGIGSDSSIRNGGSVSIQLFEDMDQCESAIPKIVEVLDSRVWTSGVGKGQPVPRAITMKCVAIKPGQTTIPTYTIPSEEKVTVDEEPFKMRKHKRWDQ